MPSSAILKEKEAIVASLAEKMSQSAAGVLVNYGGINVEDDTKLRKALREAGVSYSVMKNSLTERACEKVGLGEMKPYLVGQTAIAIGGDDAVLPAKILCEYAEKIEALEIVAGYVDGKVIDASVVANLAKTPSKEVLLAKFMGSIQSPLYNFAYAIKAIVDKENGGSEAAAE
jgi:large subunit ribosomal protein L10